MVLACLVGSSRSGWAQSPPEPSRADSAWARLERDSARAHYHRILLANPSDSRAVYRLAQLVPERDSALVIYRRYTELEPQDPWGWMALGDVLLAADRAVEAETAWDVAVRLAPTEPDVMGGRARFDGLLGRYWLRAGRARRAAAAFERSLAIRADPAVAGRLRLARALTRPALEPAAGYQRDSDGNRTSRIRLGADLAVADGARLGFSAGRTTIGDGLESYSTQEGLLALMTRPGFTTRLELRAGATRLDPGPLAESWATATGLARFRWSGRNRGPVLELSGQRGPLGTTPQLVLNQAVRLEGKLLAEVPAGPIRFRGEGRRGTIDVVGQTNHRWSIDGAVVFPLGWWGEVSLQGHRMSYQDSTSAGYFAAERVETLEAGSYLELGNGAPWLAALDLGAGGQRIQRFGEAPGDWSFAARAWGWITYSLGAGRALQLEVEGYNAPGAANAVTTSPDWRHGSVSLSIRWALTKD